MEKIQQKPDLNLLCNLEAKEIIESRFQYSETHIEGKHKDHFFSNPDTLEILTIMEYDSQMVIVRELSGIQSVQEFVLSFKDVYGKLVAKEQEFLEAYFEALGTKSVYFDSQELVVDILAGPAGNKKLVKNCQLISISKQVEDKFYCRFEDKENESIADIPLAELPRRTALNIVSHVITKR